MTPPMFSTTMTFLPRAWKAEVTLASSSFSLAESTKSALVRSKNSPELRPKVMMATSLALADLESSEGLGTISLGRGVG